jgi:phosphinothricin acetyltransferase
LVAETEQGVAGYAYATPWRARAAYEASVESTVYVDTGARGRGVGRALYDALFEQVAGLNKHVVIAGISLPNPASVALHERMGMHKVAHFEQVGRKFDRWIDVGYWQRQL